jgi:hypothetical protein
VALQRGDFEKESRVLDRLLEQGFSSTDIACAVIHELRKDDTRNLKSQVTIDWECLEFCHFNGDFLALRDAAVF